jgi:hypothetical protein
VHVVVRAVVALAYVCVCVCGGGGGTSESNPTLTSSSCCPRPTAIIAWLTMLPFAPEDTIRLQEGKPRESQH